jgi:hypothetical protein
MENQPAIVEHPYTDQDITVLVPTYKRPLMLRSCLQSIALQSRKDRIKAVLVSENSDESESRTISQEFNSQLPIVYLQNRQGFTPQEHGIWLSKQVETRYIAQIADDDMWSRYHLEEAIRCFDSHPSITSFFGQAAIIRNESCQIVRHFSQCFMQVLKDPDAGLVDFNIWDQCDTSVNCLASTPLNIWSVVALTDAHKQALHESAGDPFFGKYPSNDRLYIWRMSLKGPIGISRNLSLFYRQHPNSDIQNHLANGLEELLASDFAISQEIARQASSLGIDAYAIWRRQFEEAIEAGYSPETIEFLNPYIRTWLLQNIHYDSPKESSDSQKFTTQQLVDKLRYLLTPPILTLLQKRIKARIQQP